jgi:excisionase family DNA binding protein
MIKVNIRETAIKKGIKTAYQLQKAMNLQPSQAAKLYRNDLKMIGLDTLDRLCEIFDCMPSDLLVYDSGRAKKEKTVKTPVIAQKVASGNKSNSDLLSTAEVANRTGLSERTIRDNYKNGKLPFTKIGTKNFVTEPDFETFKTQRLLYEQPTKNL